MPDDPTPTGTQAEPVAQAQPPAGSSSPTHATTGSGTQAEPNTSSQPPGSDTMSLDEAKKLRAEHASLRKRVAEFEAAAKAAEDAKLSETEKLNKRFAELQQQHTDYQMTAQTRIMRALVRAEAAEMGLNPGLAARLVDLDAVEFDEGGDPTNLRKLLDAAAKEYGLTPSGGTQAAAKPANTAGGATNPSRSGTNGGAKVPLSWDYINQLATTNPQEYLARGGEIQRWMLDNITTRPRR